MRHIILVPLILASILLLAGTGCDVGKPTEPRGEAAPVRDAVLDAESTVELPMTYVNEKYGFRFNHGKDWVFTDQSHRKELVEGWTFAIPGENGKPEAIIISSVIKKNPKLLRYSKSSWKEFLSTDSEGKNNPSIEILDFEKIKFDGEDCVYVRMLKKNGPYVSIEYQYNYGDKTYSLGFSALESKYEKHLPAWNAVLKSYQK